LNFTLQREFEQSLIGRIFVVLNEVQVASHDLADFAFLDREFIDANFGGAPKLGARCRLIWAALQIS
jgi:hypothetical protein